MGRLTREIGVYAICDLDEVPIYIGQSVAGIGPRVRRHLTSARSDVIANRLVDVWEVAFVWAWPVKDPAMIPSLEGHLFHRFNRQKTMMNGSIPVDPGKLMFPEPKRERVQLLPEKEIQARLDPVLRLPRQIEHYQRLVDHILNVKDNQQLRRSLRAHFERLEAYHEQFLKQGREVLRSGIEQESEDGDSD